MNILIDGQTLQSPEINRGIGVYFKNVLNNMVKVSFGHNWYIALEDKEALSALDPWVAQRLIPIEDECFLPSEDYSQTDPYTYRLEEIVFQYKIDVYWNPNPLMANVLFPCQILFCRMFSTVHDLIPMILSPDWSKEILSEYKRRITFLQEHNEIELLCNSEATKQDIIRLTGRDTLLHVTPLAADIKKFYRPRKIQKNTAPVMIVFTGGFDYRKNIEGALKAFSLARKSCPGNSQMQEAQFILVCNATDSKRQEVDHLASELDLEGHVQLTGFIPDEELAKLYNTCDVFFFPSLYEGFGLPILEAMLGGAYILSANNSSLPEVCGGNAMLCDAKDPADMADKLCAAVAASRTEPLEEKIKRQEYAKTFTWEKTAKETLSFFEGKQLNFNGEKEKIAIVTPWPPQKSGIANFEFRLLPYLFKYYFVDIYIDSTYEMGNNHWAENLYGGIYSLVELDTYHQKYSHILYQIGNSSQYHTEIYKMMLKYPGVAEIHDYIVHALFYQGLFLQGEEELYRTALYIGYQKAGLSQFRAIKEFGHQPDEQRFPMSHAIVKQSKATIVHNSWSSQQIGNENVYVIPLACFEANRSASDEDIEKFRDRIGHSDDEILIGCFGFVNFNKRPEVLLASLDRLIAQGYHVRLAFFGQTNLPTLSQQIDQLPCRDQVTITGFLDRKEYEIALELCNIVVNLRYPSMGESSGTLCEALKYHKPIIVSDVAQYQEYPDEVCWKVPVGKGEVETLAAQIAYLIDHPSVRMKLGENAGAYAETVLSPERIAESYYRVLSQLGRKGM